MHRTESDDIIYTRQSFIDYPDIRLSNLNFKSDKILVLSEGLLNGPFLIKCFINTR